MSSCFKMAQKCVFSVNTFKSNRLLAMVSLHRFGRLNSSMRSRYFCTNSSGIHPDFQTSFKTGDTNLIKKQIEEDVKNNEIFVFIKGTPMMPQCGFSKNVITMLDYLEVEYKTRDVLSHPDLRAALKEYSDWPTFPQLYFQGELVGGHDIVVDMFKSGELSEMFGIEDEEASSEEQNSDK